MDIEFLLFLQTLRTETLPCLSDIAFFFNQLCFGVYLPIGLFVIIYWCCNKKIGEKLFLSYLFSLFLCDFIKCTVCVNRPWIRDSRVKPHPKELRTATGYSMPSGHSTAATAAYGALEREYNRTNIIFHFICPAIILCVMLARMVLGYHTPQDVLAGLATGLVSIFLSSVVVERCMKDKKAWLVPGVFLLIAIAETYFLLVKSYPVTPLVDPAKMRLDAHVSMAALFTYLLASTFENRFINFTPPSSFLGKVLVFVPGFVIVYCINHFGEIIASRYVPQTWTHAVAHCVMIAFIVFIWPAFFCHFTGKGNKINGRRTRKH